MQRVERGVLTPSVSGIGTVEARQSWLLGPTQAGRVLKVHVDVGQAVAAGSCWPKWTPWTWTSACRRSKRHWPRPAAA